MSLGEITFFIDEIKGQVSLKRIFFQKFTNYKFNSTNLIQQLKCCLVKNPARNGTSMNGAKLDRISIIGKSLNPKIAFF